MRVCKFKTRICRSGVLFRWVVSDKLGCTLAHGKTPTHNAARLAAHKARLELDKVTPTVRELRTNSRAIIKRKFFSRTAWD